MIDTQKQIQFNLEHRVYDRHIQAMLENKRITKETLNDTEKEYLSYCNKFEDCLHDYD